MGHERGPKVCLLTIGVLNCKAGEVSRFDIIIDGSVAAKLYELMLQHGFQDDLTGLLSIDSVATNDGG